MLARLEASADELLDTAGRPTAQPLEADKALELCAAVRDFLMEHPGAANKTASRHPFQDSFRSFVVGLFAPGALADGLSVEKASGALGVPMGTLKDWLRGPSTATHEPKVKGCGPTVPVTISEVATLQLEYANWQGTLSSFCTYARDELGLGWGRDFITSVLVLSGQHRPRSREGAAPEPWSRGTYKTLFPGVQWLGDGTQVVLDINGLVLPFNVEAMMDTASNATVGIHVSATEDAEAVVAAYREAMITTDGQCPLSVMLDHKPCNHSPAVEHGCPGTTILHSTKGRGQSKAAAEGSFGLFRQGCPDLVIRGDTIVDVGKDILRLVVTAWHTGRNGRPRRKLGGLSPTALYQSFSASPEDLERAHKLILELKQKEQRGTLTRRRRADGPRLQILEDALAELGIDDPGGRIAVSLAGYSLSAILQGIATFKAKLAADTIPSDAEHYRYLGGIIRNLDQHLRLERTSDELLRLRLKHDRLMRETLAKQYRSLLQSTTPATAPGTLLDQALRAQSLFDYRFWVLQATELLSRLPPDEATQQYRHLARVVAAHYGTEVQRREDIIRRLGEAVSLANAVA
jgi:transposase InsO family protein